MSTARDKIREKLFPVEVTDVQHYTDTLFTLRTTRPGTFRFEAGEFTMLGLDTGQEIIQRAYSMTNATYDEELSFLSIKVQDGAFTSRLQYVELGQELLVGKKPTGTLTLDAVAPGRNLYLFSTGTGIAPFMSLIQEPEIYNRYERIVLNHTCRLQAELVFDQYLREGVNEHPLVGEEAAAQLLYYPTVTREDYYRTGRVTAHMDDGSLWGELGLDKMDPEHDRAMVCGGPAMLETLVDELKSRGFDPGDRGEAGGYAIEKAFVG
jgi:ferredoxin--NADP+ reductase